MKLKVEAGSKTFYFESMEDLKKQATAELAKVSEKLSASNTNSAELEKLKAEKKEALKKLSEKFDKRIKALSKDTGKLLKDKEALEKLLQS